MSPDDEPTMARFEASQLIATMSCEVPDAPVGVDINDHSDQGSIEPVEFIPGDRLGMTIAETGEWRWGEWDDLNGALAEAGWAVTSVWTPDERGYLVSVERAQ